MDDHSPDRPRDGARRAHRQATRKRGFKASLERLEERALLANASVVATGFGASLDLRTLGVATDSTSNEYITGAFKGTLTIGTTTLTSGGDHDLFVAKVSNNGSIVWAESFRGSQWNCVCQGSSIAVDSSGNVYLTGEYSGSVDFDPGPGTTLLNSPGRYDAFVAKLSSSGALLWAQDVLGTATDVDSGQAIAVDSSGNVYTTGYFQDQATFGSVLLTGSSSSNVFVAKQNSAGQFLWATASSCSGTSSNAGGAGLALDSAGNIDITGYFAGTVTFVSTAGPIVLQAAGIRDAFVAQFNSTGNLNWAKGFGGTDVDQGNAVAVDGSGNVYSTGFFSGTADFDPGAGTTVLTSGGSSCPFVEKLDSSGRFVWARAFVITSGSAQGTGIAIDSSGTVDTAGWFDNTVDFDPGPGTFNLTSAGFEDLFLSQLDASGNYVSAQRVGGTDYDVALGLAVGSAGSMIIGGGYTGSVSFGSNTLPALAKVNGYVASFPTTTVGPPAAPSAPHLQAASDSGQSNSDGITSSTHPTFDITQADPADTVQLWRGGVMVASRTGPGALTDPGPVPDGAYSYTATQRNGAGTSPASAPALVTIDTTPPATPAAPALRSSDDSGTVGDGITNVNQPTFTGTTEPGAQVQLLNAASTVLATGTASGNGVYFLQSSSPFADGLYSLHVQVQDVAGNLSAASASLSLRIDTAAPATPALPTLLATDDSGNAGDGITSIKQPHLTGTTEAGATVQLVSSGSQVIGTAVALASGAYSVAPSSPLSDGPYYLSIRALDAAGNMSQLSPSFTLTIDTTPPATPPAPALLPTDDSGAPGDLITNIAQPHLTGSAEPGSTLRILNAGGSVVGTGTAGGTGVYSILLAAPLPQGSNALRIQATDAAGNLSTPSAVLTIIIDTTAPATPAAPVLLAADDSGLKGDNLTNIKQPHLTGLAEPAASVQLSTTLGILLGTGTAAADGSYSIAVSSPLSDGVYAVQVRATDAAGNASAFSSALNLTIDTAPPPAPAPPALLAADDSGARGDGITNIKQPHLTGTTEAGASVQLLNGSTVLASDTAAADGSFSLLVAAALADGSYRLSVLATDAAGNASTASAVFNLIIDTTAPTAPAVPALLGTDDSGIRGDGITNIKQPHLTGTTEAGALVQLLNGASTVVGSVTAAGDGSYSIIPVSTLADGSYSFRVQATDAAGNTSAPSNPLSLVIDATPPPAPGAPVLLAADDSGTRGDGITNVKQPHLTGTTEVGASVQIATTLGTLLGTATAAADGSYSVLVASALSDGVYQVQARATDAAGNTSVAGSIFTLTIDTTSPTAPAAPGLVATDDSGTRGDGITNVKQPHVGGSTEAGALVQLIDSLGTVLGTTMASGTGAYSVSPTNPFNDGPHALRVQAQDAAGNMSAASAAMTITIDTIPPAAPAAPGLLPADDTGVTGDAITSNTQPHLIGSTEPGALVQIVDATSNVLGAGTAAGDGSYSVRFASILAAGTYAVRVQATDAAGNTSAPSASFNLTIDTSGAPPAPPAPTLLPSDDSGVLGDGVTNVKQPHLTGKSVAGDTIELLNAVGTIVASAPIGSDGSYTVQVPGALADGRYTYSVEVQDTVGRVSSASPALTLTIDTMPPATPLAPTLLASDDSGIKGDGITSIKQPHLLGTTEAGATVLLLNGAAVVGTAVALSTGAFSVAPSSPLSDGAYSFSVRALDAAANASSLSPALAITIDTTAPAAAAAPALAATDDSGIKGDGITSIRQPHLIGSAEPGATVQLFTTAGTLLGTTTAGADGSYSVQTTTALNDGGYSLQVRATDAAGNLGALSNLFSLTIDSTAPATPAAPLLLAADDSGIKGDGITNIAQPHLTGTTEPGTTVLLLDGAAVVGTATAASDGSFSVLVSAAFPNGAYALSVQATDVAGNTSAPSAVLDLTIDTTPPAAPAAPTLLAADDSGTKGDRITNIRTPHLTGTTEPSASVDLLSATGAVLATASAGQNGSYSLQPPSPLGFGSVSFQVRSRDAAGNTSGPSQSLSLTIVPASTPGDYDGDGKTDIAVTRPSASQWIIWKSATNIAQVVSLGAPGDIAVSGDYDGVGHAEPAVYRPSTGQWIISVPGGTRSFSFGARGDLPVPADYDGDGKTDIGLYRPSTGQWLIIRSTAGLLVTTFGAPNLDRPVPADYDGDGKADLAVYRPNTGQWLILRSTAGAQVVTFGAPNLDQPVPADYDGDGKADIGVYRPSTGQWLILRSTAGAQVVTFGAPNLDQPLTGDFDGDGKVDIAVYRPTTATWLLWRSSLGVQVTPFGWPGVDQAVPQPLSNELASMMTTASVATSRGAGSFATLPEVVLDPLPKKKAQAIDAALAAWTGLNGN